MNRLLIISYTSPPVSSPSSDRIYGFAKHLAAFGWETFLLTVRNPFSPPSPWNLHFDTKLYRPLPFLQVSRAVDLQVELPYRALTRLRLNPRFFFPFGETLGWIPHAYSVGKKLVEIQGFDCILASNPPPSCLVIGFLLSRRYNIHLVLDYRDPWNSATQRSSRNKLEVSMENTILKRSDAIVVTTEGYRDMILHDFPVARGKRTEIVRNGFLSDMVEAEPYRFTDSGIHILHAGSIQYEERVSSMLSFLTALTILREASSLTDKMHIILAGFVHPKIVDSVRRLKLGAVVQIMSHVPHDEIRAMMKSVEYLLLISGHKSAASSKLYDYAAARKPIINIGDEKGQAALEISEYGIGATVRPDPREIAEFLRRLQRLPLKIESKMNVDSLSRERQTAVLAKVLSETVRES